MKSFVRETLAYPNNIKLIATLGAGGYLCRGRNCLEVLGDAIILGLITYGALFYSVEAIKLLRTPGSLKLKLGKILYLPILNTEPVALIITSLLSIRYYYGNAAPDPGSRIATFGMLLVFFFTLFLLVHFFLNMIKYRDKELLYGDIMRTGGLEKKIFPVLTAHIGKSVFFLSIIPTALTYMGIFIREKSFSLSAIKRYPDIIISFLFLPFGLWVLLRLMRQITPPLTVNFARLVVLSLYDLYRSARVKDYQQFLELLVKKNEMYDIWLKFYRVPSRIHREIAVNYLYLQKYDLALHHFKEYLKDFKPGKLKSERQPEMVPFLALWASKILFKRYRVLDSLHTLEENFEHLEYLRPLQTIKNIEEVKKKPIPPEMDFVFSLFFEMLCQQFKGYQMLLSHKQKEKFTTALITAKNKEQWQETIHSILSRPEEYQRESLGDSLNVVFEISNKEYFRDAFVLKGQAHRENLQKERRNTEKLQTVITDFPTFLAPVPLHITEEPIPYQDQHLYIYAMRRNQGVNVLELVQQGPQIDILKKVIEYLAIIHTHMPPNGVKTDFQAKVGSKFNNLGVENSFTQLVVQSMTPVSKSLEDTALVFGKDAHPGNWLITEKGEVVALDMEDKGIVPLEIDLVNLLEFNSFGLDRPVREKLKETIIREYLEFFKKYNTNSVVKESFSDLRYLNAVIQRMLCLYCFWSSHRDPLKIHRKFVLDNALYALEKISNRFDDYFSCHRHDYNNLKLAINCLKKSLNTADNPGFQG